MIGRYKLGSRRIVIAALIPVTTPDGGSRELLIKDDAVDADLSDLGAYQDSYFDTKHLKFTEGEEPTYFTIQQLTRRQKDAVETIPENMPRERSAFYIKCAVSRVDGFKICDEEGNIIDLPQPKRKSNGRLGAMAQDSWVDKMDLHTNLLIALAVHIKAFSEADVPLSKPSEPQSGATSLPGAMEE